MANNLSKELVLETDKLESRTLTSEFVQKESLLRALNDLSTRLSEISVNGVADNKKTTLTEHTRILNNIVSLFGGLHMYDYKQEYPNKIKLDDTYYNDNQEQLLTFLYHPMLKSGESYNVLNEYDNMNDLIWPDKQTPPTYFINPNNGCLHLSENVLNTIEIKEAILGWVNINQLNQNELKTEFNTSYYQMNGQVFEFNTLDDISLINTSKVEAIYFGSNITEIPDNFFRDSSSLTAIHFSPVGTLHKIGKNCFRKLNSLINLYIPKTIIHIGDKSFTDMVNGELVIAHDGFEYIGRGVFNNMRQNVEKYIIQTGESRNVEMTCQVGSLIDNKSIIIEPFSIRPLLAAESSDHKHEYTDLLQQHIKRIEISEPVEAYRKVQTKKIIGFKLNGNINVLSKSTGAFGLMEIFGIGITLQNIINTLIPYAEIHDITTDTYEYSTLFSHDEYTNPSSFNSNEQLIQNFIDQIHNPNTTRSDIERQIINLIVLAKTKVPSEKAYINLHEIIDKCYADYLKTTINMSDDDYIKFIRKNVPTNINKLYTKYDKSTEYTVKIVLESTINTVKCSDYKCQYDSEILNIEETESEESSNGYESDSIVGRGSSTNSSLEKAMSEAHRIAEKELNLAKIGWEKKAKEFKLITPCITEIKNN